MVQLSHVVIAFAMMLVVGAGAFFGGMQWRAGDGAEAAAAASALSDSARESGEEYIDAETPAPADAPLYKVLRVVDGDTIVIEVEGKSESVRLIGVDTPELNDSRTGVQCFAQEAAEKTKALVTGKNVRLEKDSSQGERDKYKRLLGYVFLENGAFLNLALIKDGFAHEYTYDGEYKYQKQFKAAQAEAKAAEAGLWAEETCPTTPAVRSSKTNTNSQATAAAAAAAPPPAQKTAEPVPKPKEEPQEEPKPEPEEEPEPEPESAEDPHDSSSIVCSTNTYNCGDFQTQNDAQAVYDQCGGVDNDIHKLDKNKDGSACDSLP